MKKHTLNLVVDGLDDSGNFAGDGTHQPFVVFNVDRQQNIAGPFETREQAEQHRNQILAGQPPAINAEALARMLAEADNGTAPKFASGEWNHFFGPGNKETLCRIVIDLEQSKVIAAQEWTGVKFEDVLSDRLKNLSETVIEVNEAHTCPHDWALEVSREMPEWAAHSLPDVQTAHSLPDVQTRLALAMQFHEELLESVEVLSDIAEKHGVRTLSDLFYLQTAIMNNDFIDAWPDSAVLDVVRQLPSADRWESYANVYGEDGALEKASIFSKGKITADNQRQPDVASGSVYARSRPGC